MKYKFTEVFDIKSLEKICENFTKLNGAVTALLDLDGNVHIATGWKSICTNFHRVNPDTACRCNESDTMLATKLEKGMKYNVYKCKNGLYDVAVPVFVNNEHVGNFFTGQFFFEKPDVEYFKHQAHQFGFEEKIYLKSLDEVPVYTEAYIKKTMGFLVELTQIIGEMGMVHLRTLEQREELKKHKSHLEKTVTERTKDLTISNESLKTAMKKAEAANIAKSEFLANMSHEIRTPMNAILGFSEILQDKETDQKKSDFIRRIQTSGKALLNLINDILDLSKIEAGKFDLNYTVISPATFFDELRSLFEQKIKDKGLEFIIQIDKQLPKRLILEEMRLRQILINLIGNAVKFTNSGFICLRLKVKNGSQDNQSSVRVIFEIEDSGIGISSKEQFKIFSAFEQVGEKNKIAQSGTGLGLAISKQLVEMMGGTLHVESKKGKGTLFQIIFPEIEIAATDKSRNEKTLPSGYRSVSFEPATILITDDIDFNREMLRTFLEDYPFIFHEATNGKEAIERAHSVKPDIIFLDMRMPVMDGYIAAGKMNNDPILSHIPVVAITASALKDDEKKITELCDAYIRKPVSKSELIDLLIRFLPNQIIEFDQLNTGKQEKNGFEPENIESADLKSIPGEWREQFTEAVVVADAIQCRRMIDQIAPKNEKIANSLTKLLDDFQFSKLVKLLEVDC